MRDLVYKPKNIVATAGDGSVGNNPGLSSGQEDNEKRKILNFVNEDICNVILDISFQRLLKREKVVPGSAISLGALELWSDDFEGKGDYSQYRSRLVRFFPFLIGNINFISWYILQGCFLKYQVIHF